MADARRGCFDAVLVWTFARMATERRRTHARCLGGKDTRLKTSRGNSVRRCANHQRYVVTTCGGPFVPLII